MEQVQRQRELDEMAEEEARQAARREIIEQERRRLIQEHATKLLRFLPKGVFRDARDLDALPAELRDYFVNELGSGGGSSSSSTVVGSRRTK